MELSTFEQQTKYLTPNGVALNVEETLSVSIALRQLASEMSFEETLFWGKIEGK